VRGAQWRIGSTGTVRADFVFLTGDANVVFRVALVLLREHRELLTQCDTFELTNDFLRATLPAMSLVQSEKVFNQVLDVELKDELLAYKVEFDMMDEETFELGCAKVQQLSREMTLAELRQVNARLVAQAPAFFVSSHDHPRSTNTLQNAVLTRKVRLLEEKLQETFNHMESLQTRLKNVEPIYSHSKVDIRSSCTTI